MKLVIQYLTSTAEKRTHWEEKRESLLEYVMSKKLYQTLLLQLQLRTRRSHRHIRDAERQRLRPEALA